MQMTEEEICSDTEIPIKENKKISKNNSYILQENSIKNNNEDSQFLLDTVLTNESTTNIMNTKEPNNSEKDYSEYSIEKTNENVKG